MKVLLLPCLVFFGIQSAVAILDDVYFALPGYDLVLNETYYNDEASQERSTCRLPFICEDKWTNCQQHAKNRYCWSEYIMKNKKEFRRGLEENCKKSCGWCDGITYEVDCVDSWSNCNPKWCKSEGSFRKKVEKKCKKTCGTCDGVTPKVDIDECKTGKHSCDLSISVCKNTQGSYTCTCKSGYKDSGDGKTCTDIDECASGKHNCDLSTSVCKNTQGSYTCTEKPCEDKNKNCATYKKRGYCTEKYVNWMKNNCCASCRAKNKKPCEDKVNSSNCAQWKNYGYCTQSYVAYMKKNCGKTCGSC